MTGGFEIDGDDILDSGFNSEYDPTFEDNEEEAEAAEPVSRVRPSPVAPQAAQSRVKVVPMPPGLAQRQPTAVSILITHHDGRQLLMVRQ